METLNKISKEPAYKVLIIDDIPNNIKLLSTVLQPHGIEVSFATSGMQALQTPYLSSFDLILLDIMMPGMDGFLVCEKLKKNPETSHIPVIFLTAKIEQSDIIRGFETGAVDYITKPFKNRELLSRVLTHIELKRSRDKLATYIGIIKKQNEQLDNQNKELKELNVTKDKIFSIISHDLSEPFNGLIGCSELLLTRWERLDKKVINQTLNVIHSSAKEGYSQLENLLDWSRMQVGALRCSPERVDISKFVNEAIDLLKNKSLEKKIVLKSEIASETWCFADVNMVQTIIRNLLSNALKFTPLGGVVNVATDYINGNRNSDIDMLEIRISDNGMGISQENQKKLFRLEQNFTNEGTALEKGTGLGLILCKEFVEQNNGTLKLESTIGEGSIFSFTLPTGEWCTG